MVGRVVAGGVLLLLGGAMAAAGADSSAISQLLRLPVPETLELCGEAVPLGREDVGERLELELVVTLGSPVTTALWLKRMPRSFPAIEEELRRRGLPADLKYVALVESNLRAEAVSHAGAVGPWQFMPATGAAYGLSQDSWRDARRSWEDATAAAVQHLKDLRGRFGSWPLALAAYNAGPERVARAMENQGGKDFWSLKLPTETERYVFRVLAAKLVAERPEAYGIRLEGARLYGPEATARVDLEVRRKEVPLRALSEAAGVSYRRFLVLNPWLVGTSLPRGTHRLTVPAEAAVALAATLARWEERNPEPKVVSHRVAKGDTLSGIAQRFGVSVEDLKAWNVIGPKELIRPGQTLVVSRAR